MKYVVRPNDNHETLFDVFDENEQILYSITQERSNLRRYYAI